MKAKSILAAAFILLVGIGSASGSDVPELRSGNISIRSIPWLGPPCAAWYPSPPINIGGGFYVGYCANTSAAGYQVQRDTFYYRNGYQAVVKKMDLLKCYSDPMHPGVEPHFCH
jgi:hypothetical protein